MRTIMPKVTRSNEEIEVVKEQILDEALTILEADGYEGLSMNRLGARMNMTAANLYNYYGNKNELLIAIHKRTYGMLLKAMQDAVAQSDIPFERVKKLIGAYVAFGTENVNIYDVMFNRPILQNTDYIGTALEDLSQNEYQNSLQGLIFATIVFGEYIETNPALKGRDTNYLTIKVLSQLHGIISLHNSRILPEMIADSETVLSAIIDDIGRSLEKGTV